LNREQAAVILDRAMRLLRIQPELTGQELDIYTDADAISHWAQDSVARFTAAGLMSVSGGAFSPADTLSREQAITLLMRVRQMPGTSILTLAEQPTAAAPAAAEPEVLVEPVTAADCLVQSGADKMMLSRMDRTPAEYTGEMNAE